MEPTTAKQPTRSRPDLAAHYRPIAIAAVVAAALMTAASANAQTVQLKLAPGITTTAPTPANPQGSVSLNPQPTPPAALPAIQLKPGGMVELNPQPEPPSCTDAGSMVGLNPQPEPPSNCLNPQPTPPSAGTTMPLKPGGLVGLNPQPEPPSKTLLLAPSGQP